MLDDVLPVDSTAGFHLPSILFLDLKVLLHVDLQVKHLLAFLLLDLELLKHNLGMVTLVLERMGQLHRHLSFRLEVLGLRIGFGDATPLDLVLELEVLLINAALLSQRLLDLRLGHLLLVLEVLDPRLGNRDVDFDKVSLLPGLHRLCNRLLGQVAVVELASLHVLSPAVREDFLVENINVFVKPITLFFHLVDDLLLLGRCQLVLTNVSIADQVVVVQSVVRVGIHFLLLVEDRASVLLGVHLALQTRNIKGTSQSIGRTKKK